MKEGAEHRVALAAWRGGGFPDNSSGRKIAALADRSTPAVAKTIHSYCETLTALVLAAEMALHQQAEQAGEVQVDAASEFAKLEQLEKDLGRTSLGALRPLLPFSRNDYWEVSELRERLKSR